MNNFLTVLPIVFALVVALINIIVEMVKPYTYKILPTRLLVLILGIIMGVLVAVIGCDYYKIAMRYYYIISGAIGGIVAGYVSMYGKDEIYTLLAETLSKLFRKE